MLCAKVRARFARQPDTGFRFFVTNNPGTWIHENDELECTPLPLHLWPQIRTQFKHADTDYGPWQGRLDGYFRPTPLQQPHTTARQ